MNKYKKDENKICEVVKGKLFDGMKKKENYILLWGHIMYMELG
jgi:hypothetical protein